MHDVAELDQFKSEGFLIARGLLDKSTIEAARDSIAKTFLDQLTDAPAATGQDKVFAAMLALFQQDLACYKKTAGVIWRKLVIYQLMHDPRIVEFLKFKFGWRDIFVSGGQTVHIMAHELKIQDGYFGLVPHQDFPSVQGSLDGVVVWLPLVKVDKKNFPLEVIPGSHTRGQLPMTKEGSVEWEIRPDQIREEDFIPVEVDVGDVIFMSMFTVHRSSMQGLPGRLRLALSSRFDNADEATFIERVYPSAYVRSVHRDPYFPDFPSSAQLEVIFRPSNKT